MKIKIEKLDRGYLIVVDKSKYIAVSNDDLLEKELNNLILFDIINAKQKLYFQNNTSMNINIEVETFKNKENE